MLTYPFYLLSKPNSPGVDKVRFFATKTMPAKGVCALFSFFSCIYQKIVVSLHSLTKTLAITETKLNSMKKIVRKALLVGAMLMSAMVGRAQVAEILGEWYTVDDKTGEKFSVVQIYKATNGKYYGRIDQILVGPTDKVCTECKGEEAGKPVQGMVIIRDFEEKDGKLVGGRVLDPDNGKWYYGKLYLKDGNLVLRGSLDKAGVLGRSQTWKRKK